MKEFDYNLDYKHTMFRPNDTRYRIGRGEQGVLLVRPYTENICQHWRFKTEAIEKKSAKTIYEMYVDYKKIHDFVGPICETTDSFLSLKKYQKVNENDVLAICDTGAYGIVLASNYNLRTKPAEIMINKSNFKVISKRENINKIA